MAVSAQSTTPEQGPPTKAAPSARAAVVTVALGIFTLMTTELLPAGLLGPIGADLAVSDGAVALMVTVPGLVAAVSAPVVTVVLGQWDRRTVLTGLIALMTAANAVCAWTDQFWVVLAARVLVGVSIGGFWAIAGGLAPRLVSERHVPRATAIVFGGVSAASVLGVPLGTLLGDLLDWRAAFLAVTGLGLVSFVLLLALLPPLPTRTALRFADLSALLRRHGGVRAGLLLTFLLVTGQFCAYTFIRPLLTDVAGLDPALTGVLLLGYGAAGLAGNFLAAAGRDVRRTLFTITALLTLALAVFVLLGGAPVVAVAALLLWGLAYGGVSVSLQTWMLRTAPETTEAATSLFVCAFNLSIALGALLGGLVADSHSVAATPWLGAAFFVLTATVLAFARPNPR
ncbi:MFS transporter [Nocardiopsis nanhaiensis]